MLSKKLGPPVPPRPQVINNKMGKQNSPTLSPNGRTVIYKSPSYNNNINQQENDNIDDSHTAQHKFMMMMMMNSMEKNNNKEECNTDTISSEAEIVCEKNNKVFTKSNLSGSNIFSSMPSLALNQSLSKPEQSTSLVGKEQLQDNIENQTNKISPNLEKDRVRTEIFISNSNSNLANSNFNSISNINYNASRRPDPEGEEIVNKFEEINTKSISKPLPREKKVAFHEMLISELTAMRNEDNRLKPIKLSSSIETSPTGTHRSRISTSDWVEVGDNGKEVMLSSCQINLEDSGVEEEDRNDERSSGVGDSWDSVKDSEERSSMSLPGLPPLPKSLSGVELTGTQPHHSSTSGLLSSDSVRNSMPITNRMPSTLDTQLAILRREMFGLRQLDLSLLSQLWALNESIQEFRSILQEQETFSPPSLSPTPSDANSITSDDEEEMLIETPLPRMRSAPPPPPPSNRKSTSRPV